jgi:anaerobic magnesium-protoporphyrin IX monomethyl ester cyclase
MVDLVLSRPPSFDAAERHWSDTAPLGPAYLLAVARSEGLSVAAVDGRLERHDSIEETAEKILSKGAKVVGISALTVEFSRASALAGYLKRAPEPPFVVLGGPHANAIPRRAIEEGTPFDMVVAGEGESVLPRIVRAVLEGRPVPNEPGIYQRDAAGTGRGEGRAELDNGVAGLPFPAWDLFRRLDTYPIISERGCPYTCVFCSRNLGKRMHYRPLDHVMEELEWLHASFAPREIYFEDETFGLVEDRTADLLDRMERFNRDKHLFFKAQTRVDRVTLERAQRMRKAGFGYVELGVESGDDDVLEQAQKGTSTQQVLACVRDLKSAGIKVWANFVIGLPGETRRTVRNSMRLAVEINPHRLSVAIITAYPGTEVYEWALAGKRGYRLLSTDWDDYDKYLSPSVELERLPYATMRRLQLQMYLETYARNGRFRELASMFWQHRGFFGSLGRKLAWQLLPCRGSRASVMAEGRDVAALSSGYARSTEDHES